MNRKYQSSKKYGWPDEYGDEGCFNELKRLRIQCQRWIKVGAGSLHRKKKISVFATKIFDKNFVKGRRSSEYVKKAGGF